ncbi:MAG TPA: YcxB family protein [Candidatus Angelobacter sp.]|nr:YcxB family protein [Candidatus Angelobacter sp.]
MQVEYEITPGDHLESVKIRYRSSVRRFVMTFLGIVLLLLGILTYPYFERGWSVLEISLSAWILLLQLFIPRIVHWLIYYRNRRIFGPRKVTFDEVGVISDGPQGHVETPWKSYVKFRESKRLFLLYLSQDVKGIVPKHAFKDDAQLDAFRSLVAARLPRA